MSCYYCYTNYCESCCDSCLMSLNCLQRSCLTLSYYDLRLMMMSCVCCWGDCMMNQNYYCEKYSDERMTHESYCWKQIHDL